jgi:hypothetical protein
MAWLALGVLLLLLAVPGGRGKARHRVDAPGLAAIAAFAASAWLALPVYSPGKVAIVALAGAAALSIAMVLGLRHGAPQPARWTMLALGAASCLFAVFGPADGLF